MPNKELPHHHGERNISSLQTQLDNINDFQAVAEIFKQLGDTTRIRIFWLLCHWICPALRYLIICALCEAAV